MHQIVCRLGLRHRPHWGSLQRSPDPLAGLGGGPREREGGKGGEKQEGRGGERVPECPNSELASLYSPRARLISKHYQTSTPTLKKLTVTVSGMVKSEEFFGVHADSRCMK